MHYEKYYVVVNYPWYCWYVAGYSDKSGEWIEAETARPYSKKRATHIAKRIRDSLDKSVGVKAQVLVVPKLR